MTRSENKPSIAAVKELVGANRDALREIVQDLPQEMLDGEMTEALGASKSERSDGPIGYRSGHYNRSWKDFLVSLRDRGLHGVEYVVAETMRACAPRFAAGWTWLPDGQSMRFISHYSARNRMILDRIPT